MPESKILSEAITASAGIGRMLASISFALWTVVSLILFACGFGFFNPNDYTETLITIRDTCTPQNCLVNDTKSNRSGILVGLSVAPATGDNLKATYKTSTPDNAKTKFHTMTISEIKKVFYILVVGVPLIWLLALIMFIVVLKSKRAAAGVAFFSLLG